MWSCEWHHAFGVEAQIILCEGELARRQRFLARAFFPGPISFAGVLALMIQRFVPHTSIRERAACTFRDHTSQRDGFTAGTRLGR